MPRAPSVSHSLDSSLPEGALRKIGSFVTVVGEGVPPPVSVGFDQTVRFRDVFLHFKGMG